MEELVKRRIKGVLESSDGAKLKGVEITCNVLRNARLRDLDIPNGGVTRAYTGTTDDDAGEYDFLLYAPVGSSLNYLCVIGNLRSGTFTLPPGDMISLDELLGLAEIADSPSPTVALQNLLAAHESEADPHAQYLNQQRGDARYSPTGHAHTKAQVGLGNVPNVDATSPANISQDATHRFATDAEKTTWNNKENALGFTPENAANKSTDGTFAANSNTKFPTEAAAKTYADAAKTSAISTIRNGVATAGDDLNKVWTILTGLGSKNEPSGFAGLDSFGLLDPSVIPALKSHEFFACGNQAARLALTTSQVQLGDEAFQTDTGETYKLIASNPALALSWKLVADTTPDWSVIANKPNITDISGFPSLVGQGGKFLTNEGNTLNWTSINYQPSNTNLTDIAALIPASGNVLQYKAGAWTSRTLAQLKTDLEYATVATSGNYNDLLNLPNLALKANLSGANFTGAISGTSASFTGNIGIGTNSPTNFLEINASGMNGGGISIINSGATKARMGSLGSVVPDWFGTFMNMRYNVATDDWTADDVSKLGGFFKIDVRSSYPEIAFYRQTIASNPRSDSSVFPIAQFRLDTGNIYLAPAVGNVGIGTTSPNRRLEVIDTSNSQIRASYSSTVWSDIQTDANGNTLFTNTGSVFSFNKRFRNANLTTYADNAAAVEGGLLVGDFYRMATGQVMVVY